MVLLSLKDTVTKYELLAKKALGQNFLLDMNITQKIIRESLAAQYKNDFRDFNVVEIGPGPGGLTRAIIEKNPKSLSVIEMDSRCIKIMEELKEATNIPFKIIEADALKQDLCLISESPRQIVSNLPYNISVPLLTSWLQNAGSYSAMTLMFQKEVADRIVAKSGNKIYGRLSVLAQVTCNIKHLFDINPNNFVPAPKIWSTVLLFEPLSEQPKCEVLKILEKITEKSFGQRRKMLRQSLKSLPNIMDILEKNNIPADLRAEDVTPIEYLHIAEDYASMDINFQ